MRPRTGAQLVVFPEAFVSGYPKGADFEVKVGRRTAEGREWFRRYHESAVDVPGPAVDRLGAIAREHGLHLVIGVIERDGGTLYCTVLFFGPDGALLGKHRKVMPTAMERVIWGFGDGSTLPVIGTPLGRIGAVICWENYMPLLRIAMYGKGDRALLRADRGRPRDVAADDAPHRARRPLLRALGLPVRPAVRLPVGLSGRCRRPGRRADRGRQRASSIRWARSSPGPLVTGKRSSPRSWTSTRSRGAKFDLDVVGHYARPDIFGLTVDRRPKGAVTWGDVEE